MNELMFMGNLLSAAKHHKATCNNEDCDVSLLMLQQTAEYIFNGASFRSIRDMKEGEDILREFKELKK